MQIGEKYSYLFNGKQNPQTIHYLNNENVNPRTTLQEYWKWESLNNTLPRNVGLTYCMNTEIANP